MLNKIILQGRFAAAPELKQTTNGTAVSKFTLAVEQDFKNQEGKRDVDWIDCVAWRGSADTICKYFNKGDQIIISGRLNIRPYNDKDGNKRKATEVVVDSFYFVGGNVQKEEDPVDPLDVVF